MDILLLGITLVSLIVALVMSVTAWRLIRDEKRRSAARVAALSAAADAEAAMAFPPEPLTVRKAPWSSPPAAARVAEEPVVVTHATGFLGSTESAVDSGHRQRSLAMAAIALFVVLSGGVVWMMSGSRATAAAATTSSTAPLELISLSHQRQDDKLSISGLVRNPLGGKPVERLSAVVFLFDRMGTFITSSRASVDFLKLGAGDESPFVVSLDAPPTVARYRVSFRTDEGVIPHIDRRSASAAPVEGDQPVSVRMR